MIDFASKTGQRIVATAVVVAALCETNMVAQFGWSQGAHALEKYSFAAFGIAGEVVKIFALSFAVASVYKRHYAKGIAGILVWLAVVGYGYTAALGYATVARDGMVASRMGEAGDYKSAVADRDALQTQMAAARKNPDFERTFGCSRYDASAAEDTPAWKRAQFCSAYWRAEAKLEDTKPKITSATMTEADPQAAFLAGITGWSQKVASGALMIYMTTVMEIVSSLGIWALSTSRQAPSKGRRRRVRRYRAQRRSKPRLVVANP